MAAPDTKELELLEKFRATLTQVNLPDDLNSDLELVKWIRARDNNLEEAEIMLRKHLDWRKEINYEEIQRWELPEKFQGLITDKFLGFDRDNCPVMVAEFGKWDMKTMTEGGSSEYFLKSRWKTLKEAKEMMRGKLTREGVSVSQVVVISDFNGISLSQVTLPVIRANSECTALFEANFPEFLKISVIINAPWFFPPLFNLMKLIMSEKTIGKIHVFGKNQQEWTQFLKLYVPENVLPLKYGGSNTQVSIDC